MIVVLHDQILDGLSADNLNGPFAPESRTNSFDGQFVLVFSGVSKLSVDKLIFPSLCLRPPTCCPFNVAERSRSIFTLRNVCALSADNLDFSVTPESRRKSADNNAFTGFVLRASSRFTDVVHG